MAATGYSINISAIDNATKTIAKVNKSLAGLTAPARRLNTQLAKFADVSGLSSLHQGLQRVGSAAQSAVSGLARVLPALSAITGAASIAGISALISKWAELGRALQVNAARMGTTTDKLQEFQIVGGQFGVSAEKMNSALLTLGTTMQDAVMNRNSQAGDYFRQLGIEIQSSTFKAMTGAQRLDLVREKLAAISDPLQRERIGVALLGEGYRDMGQWATASAAAIDDAKREAQKYVLTEGQLAGAGSFARSQYLLSQSVEHFVMVLSSKLAPILQPIIEQVRQFIDAWTTDDNMELLAGYVREAVTWIKEFAIRINEAVKSFGGWSTVIRGVLELGIIAWLGQLTASFAALAVTMTANPIGAVIMGLFALGVAVYEMWEHWEWVKQQFTRFWAYLEELTGGKTLLILRILFPFINLPIEIYNHWDGIKAFFVGLWSFVTAKFTEAVDLVKVIIDKIIALPETIKHAWTALKTFFSDIWTGIGEIFDNAWKKIEGIVNQIKGAVNFILHPFGKDDDKTVASNTLPGSYGSATAPNGVPNLGPRFGPQVPIGPQPPAPSTPNVPIQTDNGPPLAPGDPRLPRGIRNNNPLNLEYRSDQGAAGTDGRFGRFRTMEQGVGAAWNQLKIYQDKHHVSTLGGMIARWAPPSENDTASYTRFVSERTGLKAGDVVDLNNPEIASAMIAAMARRENGREIDMDAARRGVNTRLGVANPPAGTPVPARPPGSPNPTPTLAPNWFGPQGTGLPSLLPQLQPLPSLAQAPPQAANGQVQVNVNITGAPAGTTVSTSTAGAGLSAAPARVSSLPSIGALA